MSDRTHAAHALKLKAGPAWAGYCLWAATNRPTDTVSLRPTVLRQGGV